VSGIIAALVFVYLIFIDQYVQRTGAKYISDGEDVPEAEALLILGANVFPDGTVSLMLHDRLTQGYELYKSGKARKIIVSGDHSRKDYDEVHAMKKFLIEKGVPPQDVFMDHAGFSTYESVYRARDIFRVKKVIIVTQRYHLPRAIYSARQLGLDAYGAAADLSNYGEVVTAYRLREAAARNKDYLLATFIKPKPTFLGEEIPVTGDGRATEDE